MKNYHELVKKKYFEERSHRRQVASAAIKKENLKN